MEKSMIKNIYIDTYDYKNLNHFHNVYSYMANQLYANKIHFKKISSSGIISHPYLMFCWSSLVRGAEREGYQYSERKLIKAFIFPFQFFFHRFFWIHPFPVTYSLCQEREAPHPGMCEHNPGLSLTSLDRNLPPHRENHLCQSRAWITVLLFSFRDDLKVHS